MILIRKSDMIIELKWREINKNVANYNLATLNLF